MQHMPAHMNSFTAAGSRPTTRQPPTTRPQICSCWCYGLWSV